MRKNAYELMSPRIEKYLSEKDRPQTAKEIAEVLELVQTTVHGVLQLMEVFNVVQKVKRMGRYRYFLNGAYDDEQLSAMFPIEKAKPKRRKYAARKQKSSELPVQESFLEEHLSSMRLRASSGEGPSALAMIGLTQIEVVEDIATSMAKVVLGHLDIEAEVEERRVETPRKIEPFYTVGHLPKDARKLSRKQTKKLKEKLREREGYGMIERFKTAFADFSALKNRSYGTIFYFSMGTNPWEKIYRVTVDDSISLEMEKPVKRLRGRRSKYDPIIDRFIELGQDLVEIDVEGRKTSYVESQLRRRIEKRGLEIVASSAGGFVYLERPPGE